MQMLDIPLKFASDLSAVVNDSFGNGAMLNKVSDVTADLLRWWFNEDFSVMRPFNFHSGQRQAILNTIYVHEVLKCKSVFDMYQSGISDATLPLDTLGKEKNKHPKYCVKMATGTGKTWVMHALLVGSISMRMKIQTAVLPIRRSFQRIFY